MWKNLDKRAIKIIQVLKDRGFDSYIVGGTIRDIMLNKSPKDCDIATMAKCQDVINIFPDTVLNGVKHGTVMVIIDRIPYDVTSIIDSGSSDLREDLGRRDFTINAMAYDPINQQLHDYFGGQEDLNKRRIYPVNGNADKVYSADPLRMLRAFRLAAQLGFDMCSKTLEMSNVKNVLKCAPERVRVEIEKFFSSLYYPQSYLNDFLLTGLLEVVLKQISFISNVEKEESLNFLSGRSNSEKYRICKEFDTLFGWESQLSYVILCTIFRSLPDDTFIQTVWTYDKVYESLNWFKFSSKDQTEIAALIYYPLHFITDSGEISKSGNISFNVKVHRSVVYEKTRNEKILPEIYQIVRSLCVFWGLVNKADDQSDYASIFRQFYNLKEILQEVTSHPYLIKHLDIDGNHVKDILSQEHVIEGNYPPVLIKELLTHCQRRVMERPYLNCKFELSKIVKEYLRCDYKS